jgi:hypothetical protein
MWTEETAKEENNLFPVAWSVSWIKTIQTTDRKDRKEPTSQETDKIAGRYSKVGQDPQDMTKTSHQTKRQIRQQTDKVGQLSGKEGHDPQDRR